MKHTVAIIPLKKDLTIPNDRNSNLPHKTMPTLLISKRNQAQGSKLFWWVWHMQVVPPALLLNPESASLFVLTYQTSLFSELNLCYGNK